LREDEIKMILEKMIQVLIHPTLQMNNKLTVAESLESGFHFLALSISKKGEGIEAEENKEGFSISKEFAENILNLLIQ
jgi:hypothetical protein